MINWKILLWMTTFARYINIFFGLQQLTLVTYDNNYQINNNINNNNDKT